MLVFHKFVAAGYLLVVLDRVDIDIPKGADLHLFLIDRPLHFWNRGQLFLPQLFRARIRKLILTPHIIDLRLQALIQAFSLVLETEVLAFQKLETFIQLFLFIKESFLPPRLFFLLTLLVLDCQFHLCPLVPRCLYLGFQRCNLALSGSDRLAAVRVTAGKFLFLCPETFLLLQYTAQIFLDKRALLLRLGMPKLYLRKGCRRFPTLLFRRLKTCLLLFHVLVLLIA